MKAPLAYLNFKVVLSLPTMGLSAQTHKSISFIRFVWSTLYVYLCHRDGKTSICWDYDFTTLSKAFRSKLVNTMSSHSECYLFLYKNMDSNCLILKIWYPVEVNGPISFWALLSFGGPKNLMSNGGPRKSSRVHQMTWGGEKWKTLDGSHTS